MCILILFMLFQDAQQYLVVGQLADRIVAIVIFNFNTEDNVCGGVNMTEYCGSSSGLI